MSRLKEVRDFLGLSQQKLADEINEKRYRINDMESGKTKIQVDIAEIFEEKFNINPWWLLTGKGKMLQKNEEILPNIPNKALSTDVVSINYYPDVYAAAGYGAINSNLKGKIMTFDRNFIEEFLNVRKIENLDIIRVVGESMEPFIHNGELVLLERSNEARNGETVIANINGEVFVKRFQADPFRKWIRLISDNKLYGDIFLESPEEIQALTIVGIVRAKIKPF
jgi:phage repressor protein C with HTH and peptisase S24 domain